MSIRVRLAAARPSGDGADAVALQAEHQPRVMFMRLHTDIAAEPGHGTVVSLRFPLARTRPR
jgi:hypothetical protein